VDASIVAEYVTWGDTTLQAEGLGSYIAQMTATGDFPRIALGIGAMCVFVMGMNHFVWRRSTRWPKTGCTSDARVLIPRWTDMAQAIVELRGVGKSFKSADGARVRCSKAWTFASPRARSSRCSARAARASRPCCASWPG